MPFGIGDFFALEHAVERLVRGLNTARSADSKIRDLQRDLEFLAEEVEQLCDDAETPSSILRRSGEARLQRMRGIVHDTMATLDKIERFCCKHGFLIDRRRSKLRQAFGRAGFAIEASKVDKLRSRIQWHCTALQLVLVGAGNSSLTRIEEQLEQGRAYDFDTDDEIEDWDSWSEHRSSKRDSRSRRSSSVKSRSRKRDRSKGRDRHVEQSSGGLVAGVMLVASFAATMAARKLVLRR